MHPVHCSLHTDIHGARDQGILSSREGDLSSPGKHLRSSGKSGQPQRAFRNGEAGGLCEPKRFIVKTWKTIKSWNELKQQQPGALPGTVLQEL